MNAVGWIKVGFSVALGVIATSALLRLVHPFAYLDLELTPIARGSLAPKVVVVVIRRETFERLATNPLGGTLARRYHARLLRALRKAGAQAVVYDLFFSDPSSDDASLRAAIGEDESMPIVLPVEPIGNDSGDNDRTEFRVRRPAILPLLRPPYITLANPIPWDPDGVIRGVRLFIEDRDVPDTVYPNLSLAGVMVAQKLDLDFAGPGWLRVGDRRWPLGPGYGVPIRWSPRAPEIEFSEALRSLETGNAEAFRGAVVIVAATNQGQRLDDIHPTSGGDMSGGQFVAQAYMSLSAPASKQPRYASELERESLASAFSLLALLALTKPSGRRVLLGLVAPWVLAAALSIWCARERGVLFGLLSLGTAPMLSALTFLGLHAAATLPIWARLGWEDREEEVCAMFVDLCASTESLARAYDPAAFLAEALALVSAAVDSTGGFIERTMGDGAFIVFRRGNRTERAQAAYRCMIALKSETVGAAERFLAKYGVAPVFAVGAELADVRGSVLRSRGRQEFTSFGRDIARAQRLETASRQFPSLMAIGPRMRAEFLVADDTFLEHQMPLKGFPDETTSVFEVTL